MNYRIERSRGNWCVQRRHVHTEQSSTPGRVEWKVESWHGNNLDSAVRKMLEFCVQDNYPYASSEIEGLRHALQQAKEDVLVALARLPERYPEHLAEFLNESTLPASHGNGS